MHIPDGFLDAKTIVAASALSITGITIAVRNAKTQLAHSRIPLLGLTAAFIFAAQMLNFPVVAGTSGHLVGGVLAAVLLGPCAALLAITAVLVVQCLVFADGGVLALGANIFNMGIVCAGGGYILYRSLNALTSRLLQPRTARLFSVAVAAWASTVLAAITCAGQLAWSGTVPWRAALTAMAGIHAFIGVGEAIITTLIVAAVLRVQPDLILGAIPGRSSRVGVRPERTAITGLLALAGVAIFVAPFACRWPDGLERVATAMGFESRVRVSPVLPAPIADYQMPGIHWPVLATILAAAIGTVVVFVVMSLVLKLAVRRPPIVIADETLNQTA